MEAWALYIQLNCAQPRMLFPAFFEKVIGYRYPGWPGMDMGTVNARIAEAIGEYASYSVRYAEECRFKKSGDDARKTGE